MVTRATNDFSPDNDHANAASVSIHELMVHLISWLPPNVDDHVNTVKRQTSDRSSGRKLTLGEQANNLALGGPQRTMTQVLTPQQLSKIDRGIQVGLERNAQDPQKYVDNNVPIDMSKILSTKVD